MNPAIFNLCKNSTINCYKVGEEQEPVLQADSFFEGIEDLKAIAVDASNFDVSDSYYPGIRMPLPTIYSAALAKHLQHYIRNFFGCDLKRVKKVASRFSIVTTPPERLNLMQRIPHFDAPTKSSLAVIHYLVDAPNYGTGLYRHNKTGFEYVDSGRYERYMREIGSTYSEPALYPDGYICGDTEEFSLLKSFDAVCNRLIMYRGSSLHSGMIGKNYNFDPNPATGRLTIATFFEFY